MPVDVLYVQTIQQACCTAIALMFSISDLTRRLRASSVQMTMMKMKERRKRRMRTKRRMARGPAGGGPVTTQQRRAPSATK